MSKNTSQVVKSHKDIRRTTYRYQVPLHKVVNTSMDKINQYHRRGGTGHIVLAGVADIFEASDIHATALKAFADTKAKSVTVDLTDLERMDLSTIQILLALQQALNADGRTMVAQNLPEVQASAWNRIGLSL